MARQQSFRSSNSFNNNNNNNGMFHNNERLVPMNSYARSESSQISRSSRRFSAVRDDWQIENEFFRKQRIERYMEEERERSERMKLLGYEQDRWTKLRVKERVERIRFLSTEEVAELMRREAEANAVGEGEGKGSQPVPSLYQTGIPVSPALASGSGLPLSHSSSSPFSETYRLLHENERNNGMKRPNGMPRGGASTGQSTGRLNSATVRFNPHMDVVEGREGATAQALYTTNITSDAPSSRHPTATKTTSGLPSQETAPRPYSSPSRSMESFGSGVGGTISGVGPQEWTSLSVKQLFRDLMRERELRKELEKKVAQLSRNGSGIGRTTPTGAGAPPSSSLARQLKGDLARTNESLKQQQRENARLQHLLDNTRGDHRQNADTKRREMELEKRVAQLQRQLQESEEVAQEMRKRVQELQAEVDYSLRARQAGERATLQQGRKEAGACAEYETIISNLRGEIRVLREDAQFFQEKAQTAEKQRDHLQEHLEHMSAQQPNTSSTYLQNRVAELERQEGEIQRLRYEDRATIADLREALRLAELEKKQWSDQRFSTISLPPSSMIETEYSMWKKRVMELEKHQERDEKELQYWKKECDHLRTSLECCRQQATEATKSSNASITSRLSQGRQVGNNQRNLVLQEKLEEVNERLRASEERVKVAEQKVRELREQRMEDLRQRQAELERRAAEKSIAEFKVTAPERQSDGSPDFTLKSISAEEVQERKEGSYRSNSHLFLSSKATADESTFHMDEIDSVNNTAPTKSGTPLRRLSSTEVVPSRGSTPHATTKEAAPREEWKQSTAPISSDSTPNANSTSSSRGTHSLVILPENTVLLEDPHPENTGDQSTVPSALAKSPTERQSPTEQTVKKEEKATTCC